MLTSITMTFLGNYSHFHFFAEKSRPAAGTHRFPFEVQLNRSLPTSLEEEVANNLDDYTARVRYKASVYLNELCDGDPIHEEIFTLIKPLDLKMLPNLQVI